MVNRLILYIKLRLFGQYCSMHDIYFDINYKKDPKKNKLNWSQEKEKKIRKDKAPNIVI